MERHGQVPAAVMKMALAVFVFLVIVTLVVTFKNRFAESTNDTISCGGLIGTLGGKDGVCKSLKSCDDGANAEEGYYFQYVGEGLGCPKGQYCCVQVPEGSNPMRASTVRAMRCQSMEAGTWGYSKMGVASCTPLPSNLVVDVDEQITFYYKPKPEDTGECGIQPSFAPGMITTTEMKKDGRSCYGSVNEDGVVVIETSVIRMYDAFNLDKSRLNEKQIAASISMRPGQSVPLTIRNVEGNNLRYTFCSAQSEGTCKSTYVGQSGEVKIPVSASEDIYGNAQQEFQTRRGICAVRQPNDYRCFVDAGASGSW